MSPKVDVGPKAYKEYWPSRRRLVIRFSVAGPYARKRVTPLPGPPFFVYDMDTGKIAARTSKEGYGSKKEAVRVARDYRDRYGAYTKAEF